MQTRTITRRPNARAALLSASVLAIFLAGMAGIPEIAAATSSSSSGATAALDSVAVTIQPTGSASVSSFDLAAYNATGSPVASYTGQYPSVTFELPAGAYLLVATANGQSSVPTPVCCGCAQTVSSSGVVSPPAQASSGGASSATTAIPCCCGYPPAEYGYALVQVSGPTSVNIPTLAPSSIPTSDVSVAVSYKNGTAVAGAFVSATAVGENFYWDSNTSITMSAQTGHDGVAHLVVPQLPLTVSAFKSVQISLPKNQTTIQVNVGGQLVNVTVYYSPTYVYLGASALLIPPQTSLSMVLTAQSPQVYPPVPVLTAGTSTASPGAVTGSASPANSGNSQTSQTATTTSQSTTQLSTIPPIPSTLLASMTSSHASTAAPGSTTLSEVGVIAVAGGAAAIAAVAISKRRG